MTLTLEIHRGPSERVPGWGLPRPWSCGDSAQRPAVGHRRGGRARAGSAADEQQEDTAVAFIGAWLALGFAPALRGWL
jgi:hypothetical protein